MANETFPLRIQLKTKTTDEWAAEDPVLLDREPAIERLLDGSIRFKVGRGGLRWSQLPYLEANAELPQPLGTSDVPTFANIIVPGFVLDGGTFS